MDLHAPDPRKLELLELQRQHKHMELDRRAYTEDSQSHLKKQQGLIDKLRKDNNFIKSDISDLVKSSCRAISSSEQDTIHKMHDQVEKYSNAIERELKSIELIDDQISLMKHRCQNQRRTMGGVNASKNNMFMIHKQIGILENRLDKSLIKYNEAIAHNKVLSDDIDNLRRERVVFENIYRKIERELQDRKQKMIEIIEASNQSYEQRDSHQQEIAAIEQANRREQEEFEEQMVELGRLLESELRLPVPGLSTKRLVGSSTGPMRESSGGMGMGVGVGDFNSSLNTKENFPSGQRNIVANRADVRSMERVQNFEEAFDKIIAATGITDIEGLVRTFIQNEDHNFSLFNYVNEQNNEIEKLQEQIQLLGAEEKEFAVESGDDFHQHKQALKELESKLLTNDLMAEKYDVRCQDLQRTVENLKRGIQSIHEKFSIDGGEEKINIGLPETVVTESNMAQHLAAIEQKANVILQMYAEQLQHVATASTHASATGFAFKASTESGLKASTAKDEQPTATVLSSGPTSSQPRRPSAASVGCAVASSVLGAGPKVPMGQDALHVNPPKLHDCQSDEEEEDDDDDTRPLTREELKVRTLNRLQKKVQAATGAPRGAAKKKAPSSKSTGAR